MTAQNIIWTKNYELKEGINKLKEENSSLKARIWNVEKENRKMDRQIETWGLKKTLGSGVVGNSNGKPYIDTATA
jgi:FtsZ-binding cell division protein ZapB